MENTKYYLHHTKSIDVLFNTKRMFYFSTDLLYIAVIVMRLIEMLPF